MVKKKKINENIVDSVEVQNKRIKNFLNNELKSYANYTLRSRTMPNIMDGLRIGGRKIIYASLTGDLAKRKFIKMQALQGDCLKLHYDHGDSSLAGTIVNLCSKHVNKYAPLEAIGQIPSLRVPKCDTATRYLSIRKSPYLDFFNVDKELLNIQEEEGDKTEPTYFLPIIPVVLINRTSSPGFGFSFKSFSYNIDSIIDCCIQSITSGTCMDDLTNESNQHILKPEIVGIKPENIIYNSAKERWYNVGEYNMDFSSDTMVVTDLPFDISFESYEQTLQLMKDKFLILSWINNSQRDKISYVIKFPKGRLKTLYQANTWNFFKAFKLYSIIDKDILNCIDQDGQSILFFDNPYQLIDTFINKRLKFYEQRKIRTIKVLKENIEEYTNRINFINLVVEGKIVVVKRALSVIKADLLKYSIPTYVLDMKIWNLTTEEIDKLYQKTEETKKLLDYIEKTTIQEMYVMELIEFKKAHCTINTELI